MRFVFLPPVVLVILVSLMWVCHVQGVTKILIPSPLNYVGLVLIIVGLLIANWHARLFRKSKLNINTFGEPTRLTKEGLFTKTRNPMYLGFIICMIGFAIYFGSILTFFGPIVFFMLANFYYIPFEERLMLLKFGNEYSEYKKEVSRWF